MRTLRVSVVTQQPTEMRRPARSWERRGPRERSTTEEGGGALGGAAVQERGMAPWRSQRSTCPATGPCSRGAPRSTGCRSSVGERRQALQSPGGEQDAALPPPAAAPSRARLGNATPPQGNPCCPQPPLPQHQARSAYFSDPQKLVFCCRTTSASTAPCTSRRMCCPTHCASYCAPCQPLL